VVLLKFKVGVENSVSYDNMRLEVGVLTRSGNFRLTKKVTDFNRFIELLDTEPSIFMRHRMYPTSFVIGWPIRLCRIWIKCGMIWETEKVSNQLIIK
jgi:hypothetical protein